MRLPIIFKKPIVRWWRTYYLTVEYGNRILTAQTTIPEVDSLEAITVALSSNPIFSSDVSMPTNINGGLGFWCGYAVTRYNVIIGDSIK